MTGLVTCLLSVLYLVNGIRESRSHVSEQMRLHAINLCDNIRLALYAGNGEALAEFAREAARSPHMREVEIRDKAGRVVARYRTPGRSDGSEPIVETVTVTGSSMGLDVESALNGGQRSEPALLGTVRLYRESSDLVALVRRMVLLTCVTGLSFWFLVSLLCHLVLYRVTMSFNELMRGLEMVRSGDYSTQIGVLNDDEPGRAAAAVNELAVALRSREEENVRLTRRLLDTVEMERTTKNELAFVNARLEREVAERTEAELALRESENNLRTLMNMMPVGVSWSLPDGTVEYVNDYILREGGYERNRFATADEWYEHVFPDPEYRARIAELRSETLACAAAGEEIPTYEARVTCGDGSVRHVLFRHQICMGRNVAVMVDITERELFLEQMIKSQKLESLGVLAGGIAHNFNNVLTGVMGYISYARMFLDPSHKSHAALGHAEDASRRAAGLANQLLTFARGGEPIKRPLSVARLLNESLSLALNGSTVRRVVELPDDLSAIMADEGQISQVFNNIIINASQAMPVGGTLAVRAENVTMVRGRHSGAPTEPFVRITFTDQGEGIPSEILSKIFDPYFTTKSTGTGLGLASVHSIVSRHGGVVTVDSEVGRGSCFAVMLPAVNEQSSVDAHVSRSLTPGGAGSGRVLVMDDEEGVREFARESLTFLGYRVTCCVDGQDAVNIYRAASEANDPFFAVILDLAVAEGMGGEETARRILEFDPSARLIVSSGYSYDPIMEGYREHGFCAAVTKPYKVDQLGQELSFLKNGSREGATE
jgi:nitrogen-specific signal transduction histidine kinase/ActR/RegA family two-component response regulator